MDYSIGYTIVELKANIILNLEVHLNMTIPLSNYKQLFEFDSAVSPMPHCLSYTNS